MSEPTALPLPGWEDPSEHCWTLRQPRRAAHWVLVMLATFLAIPALLFGACLLTARLSPLTAAVLASVLAAFFLARYLLATLRGVVLARSDVDTVMVAANRSLLATAALGGLVYLMVGEAPALGRAFAADGHLPSLREWLALLGGELADITFFDVPEALGWSESPLAPQTRTAIWALGAFRLLLAVGLVEMVARLWQRFVTGTTFYGTVREAWARCAADLDPDALLTFHGTVRLDPATLECRAADLVKVYEKRADTEVETHLVDQREEV